MAEYVVEFGKDGRAEADGRLDAAAFHRNHAPIWAVLQPFLAGQTGDVLEAGSGTGQHVVHFARHQSRHHLVAERSQRGASEEHRGMARACGVGECPAAAAHRSVRSRLGRGDGERRMVRKNCSRCSAPM